jgi:hypothetical protein
LTFFVAVSGVIVLLLYFIINSKEEYRLKAKSYLGSDVQIVLRDNVLGNIYKVKTLYFPEDSVNIYYWRGNRLLKSQLQAENDMRIKHLNALRESNADLRKSISVVLVDNDSIYVFRVNRPDSNIIVTYIYDNEIRWGVANAIHIYGTGYSLEESYGVALCLLYGKKVKYEVGGFREY